MKFCLKNKCKEMIIGNLKNFKEMNSKKCKKRINKKFKPTKKI